MIPEGETLPNLNNVLFIMQVLIAKLFQDSDLNFSLSMQFLAVLENFHCYLLLSFVVQTAQADAESSSAKSALYLITVLKNLASLIKIISEDIIVSSVKKLAVGLLAFGVWCCSSSRKIIAIDFFTWLCVYKPYLLKAAYFFLLKVT